ncbi:MAG: helicase-related protein [Actinomycetia bacterium]|nr:helicase-related protein [Actinomycetes bacterium]
MSKLEDLAPGTIADGIEPSGPVTVVSAVWHGDGAITLTYRDDANQPQEQLLYRSDEGTFTVREGARRAWSFDGDGHLFRLAAEARRIQLAHLFDPYLALTSSEVDPLPHQIEAVYGEMLPRQPLRFLLADDPGAGKTIMAGLYTKELIIRGDAERILVIAPGGLVTQWQDELFDKFGLRFEIVTKDMVDSTHAGDVFQERDRLICRVDQIARREDLVERLRQTDWDLVVVDEAHRMSAHFFGAEVKKTKRYQLGEALGAAARHLLLVTATPHAGKEEDFQLFLALLDSDRFEGRFRDGVHSIDPSDLMRRMVKEKLLTFEGKPLFPERRATTIGYELSSDEMTLYDEVTGYVREQMNRADRLTAEGQGRRGNTVGFALTMLQRRLASSPEAIYQSLTRRRKRLENRLVEERQRARASALGMTAQEKRLASLFADTGADENGFDLGAWDDLDSEEQEELETEVVDAATAAATVSELELEIHMLEQLETLARRLRSQSVDAKWVQLSGLLSTNQAMFGPNGSRRKLLIFTEHRDTMNYLVDRLRAFLGDAAAVEHISGSTPRDDRRRIQARFTQDENCLALVATDAAGEGINLQRAHLVINYDLPWNPNRIEQRFGRVHRIGQTEVCHMWNLVAAETREAQVYLRLLAKIEQQRAAYQGQVFDVLGEALSGAELHRLLLDAIRYGEDPAVRDRINHVIDNTVEARIRDAIEHAPLAEETMAFADVERIRLEMQEAATRRLQPHYIRAFFEAALTHLGGKLVEREPGRFQIATVPPSVRDRDRQIGTGPPVLKRYERITFDKEATRQVGAPPAEFLAPGHPLLSATIDVILERHRGLFTQGTVLVDDADHSEELRVLVTLEHSIANGHPARAQPRTVVSRRLEFVEIDSTDEATAAGYAPYLDYRPLTDAEYPHAQSILESKWLDTDLEAIGTDHAISVVVPRHLTRVRLHTENRVEATLAAVKERLTREINYWDHRANELQEKASAGKTPQPNADRARQRADQLAQRLQRRVSELQAERSLRALQPTVEGGALVVPAGLLRRLAGATAPEEFALSRAEVERRAIDAVLAAENQLGWHAVDLNEEQPNHPGFDIRSRRPGLENNASDVKFIEVKGRVAGTPTVTVSRNEILTALNEPEHYVLALVEVAPGGADTVRYLRQPFQGRSADLLFDITSVNFTWPALWDRASTPS